MRPRRPSRGGSACTRKGTLSLALVPTYLPACRCACLISVSSGSYLARLARVIGLCMHAYLCIPWPGECRTPSDAAQPARFLFGQLASSDLCADRCLCACLHAASAVQVLAAQLSEYSAAADFAARAGMPASVWSDVATSAAERLAAAGAGHGLKESK